ncbi:MAG: AMP-binding protein, partial [Deltaproteobacteria bacterium]|nr:AMP-binding protein [Deltaproteobacteria bacterium]
MAEVKVPGHFAYELDAKAEGMPDFGIVTFENGSFPEEVITYGDIAIKGRKLARALKALGIGRGDAFALLMGNHPEFIYSLYAATLTGAILVPIDPRTKGDRLRYVLKDSQSKGLIVASELFSNLEEVLPGLTELKIFGVLYKEGMPKPVSSSYPDLEEIFSSPETSPPDNRNDDLNTAMEIIYTSGTTGDPKGVVIKQARITAFSKLARYVYQYQEDERPYTGLSLTHGNAQAVTMAPSLLLGLPSVFSRKFTKSRIWDICRKYGCTTFSLLGGMMMAIYSEPPRLDDADNPVRLVLSAGTPKSIWEDFEKRFGVLIHEWYGAVEGGFAHKPPGVGPLGSFGKPLAGMMEMKVVREDGSEAEPFETGEIICALVGQKTEVEYLGKKRDSTEKTRGGWLRTGDMGHRDKEGWFFFDYRQGGGLRRSGDFIQPDYVEAAIALHPDVTDVCVYGI